MKEESTANEPTSAKEQQPGPMRSRRPSKLPKATLKPDNRNGQTASPNEAPKERVTADGLVHIQNPERVEALPLYCQVERGRWYGPNLQGGFSYMPDSQVKSLIAEHGFNKTVPDETGNTQATRAFLWLSQRHAVAYAGPLAGHRAGIHEYEGKRILVTDSPRLIEPEPGHWPVLRKLIDSLLTDEEHPQTDIFYTWLAESFRAFWHRMSTPSPWPVCFCPALSLFGPKQCGKTALIELVLAPLFGSTKGDPMNYLRKQQFNKDLFGGSLLVLDDKGASSSLSERRERGERIKDLIWKQEQRMEGKGVDAIMLRPFWRLVIAGNDDDAGLQVCPALSPSLEDKLILLRAQPAEGLPTTHEENEAWAKVIRKELPAFAAFLLTYRPPDGLKLDNRSRVATFWHPDLVAALRDMQPEMRLVELIDGLDIIPNHKPCWEGSASDFERTIRQKDQGGSADRLFPTGTSAGRMLAELARVAPHRVEKRNHSGTSHYRIYSPEPE